MIDEAAHQRRHAQPVHVVHVLRDIGAGESRAARGAEELRAARRRPRRTGDEQRTGRARAEHRDVAVELVGTFGPVLRTGDELQRTVEVGGEPQFLAELLGDTVGLDGLLDGRAVGLVEVEVGVDIGLRVAGQRRERAERGLVLLHRREPHDLSVGTDEVGRGHAVGGARPIRVVGDAQTAAAHHLAAVGQHVHVVIGAEVARIGLEHPYDVDGVGGQRGVGVHELAGRIEHRARRHQRGTAGRVGDRVGAAARCRGRHQGRAVEGDERLRRRRVVVVRVLGTELERVGVGGLPLDGERAAHAVAAADLLAARGLVEPFVVELVAVEAQAEGIAERQRHARLQFVLVVVGVLGRHLARDLVVRILGDVRDGTGERRATVERALRTLHDLDALDVDETGIDEQRTAGDADGLARHIDAVDQRGDVRAAARRRQAADHDAGVVRRDAAVETERGVAVDHTLDVLDALALQRIGTDGGHRQRDIDQRLLTLARRDDDFVEPGFVVGCLPVSRQSHGEDKRSDPQGVVSVGRFRHFSTPVG